MSIFGLFRRRRMVSAAVILSLVLGFSKQLKAADLTEAVVNVNKMTRSELNVKQPAELVDANKKMDKLVVVVKDSAVYYINHDQPDKAYNLCVQLNELNKKNKNKVFDELTIRAPIRDAIFRLYKKLKVDRDKGSAVAINEYVVLIKLCDLISAGHFQKKFAGEFEGLARQVAGK